MYMDGVFRKGNRINKIKKKGVKNEKGYTINGNVFCSNKCENIDKIRKTRDVKAVFSFSKKNIWCRSHNSQINL